VFVLVFGAIVTLGTKHVDLFNRLMMFVKFGSLFVLMTLIANHVHIQNYSSGQAHYLLPALTVVVTSFGFSIIVPSMRAYFHNDIKQVRMAILVGSFIPLLCYLAWEAVIVGAIPLEGDTGLARLMQSAEPVTSLVQSISFYIPADVVVILTKLFTSICILTAFVCVSLGLADYLADGFSVEKQGLNNIIVSLFTFIPPLIIAVFYPRAFILFLSIAGLCCVLLQALMPAMMAWRVRYHQKREMTYQVIGGKPALLLAMMASTVIMAVSGYYLLMGVS
jgi:tyrosine-specific transport protein